MSDGATKFGCIVRAVVTDNEKKMEGMRRELKEANDDLVGDGVTPQQVTA